MGDKPAYERRAERAAELRVAHARIIDDAGIPADRRDAVLDELGSIFEVHANSNPVYNHSAQALQAVIDAAKNAGKTKLWAEKLQERLRALPVGLRFSIVEHLGYRDGDYVAADTPSDVVLARATQLQERVQRGRGRPRAELATLLFTLVLLFENEFPNAGITMNGSGADLLRADELLGNRYDHRYGGPLLDLVLHLLDAEAIEYESRGAVGRELWQLTKPTRRGRRGG